MMRKRLLQIISMLLTVTMLSGCSENIEIIIDPVVGVSKEKTKMEKQVIDDPTSFVRVMIDKNGYECKDTKKVYFIGVNDVDSFKVVDYASKKTVYEGETHLNGNVFMGDFTDVNIEGEYYIETKKIGRSYPVYISDTTWDELFLKTLEDTEARLLPDSLDNIIDNVMGTHILLFALQSYPEVFEQDNTLITSLLKTANAIMNLQSENGSYFDDYKATAASAGVMLMCAEQFGKYDAAMSESFKETADKAKRWMEKNSTLEDNNAAFYYRCQCFHADNASGIYKDEIESYIMQNIDNIADDTMSFWGAALYISSEKNTDRDICTKIMQSIVAKIEKITESVKKKEFYVDTTIIGDMMHEVLLVCFIDYITPSREYMEIIKNTMHYLLGANMRNDIILQEAEEWNSLWSCISVLCLADINN